jgi:hypothetical protein
MDSETLRARARSDKRASARRDRTYAALLDAIWQAADEGWRQVDIVREVGLTRERVRQICDPKYRAQVLKRRQADAGD